MNTKIIIAGIIAGIASFLLGWLVWGTLLMDYYESNMLSYEGLEKDPTNMVGLAISQIAGGLLVAYVIGNFKGAVNWRRGAVIGLMVGGLVTLMMDLYFFSFFNWFGNNTIMIVDFVSNTLVTALVGAVAGWYLGRGAQG